MALRVCHAACLRNPRDSRDAPVSSTIVRDLERITLAMSKRRRYASFFEFPNKELKELGIVQQLLTSLATHGRQLNDPSPYHPDPPDCICSDARGNRVALELVELVSEEAVRRNAKGEEVYRWWEPSEIRAAIGDLLSRKDVKSFNGGPYADIAVVIFTDEPVLTADEARKALKGVEFGPFRQLTLAFLMFSYMPGKGYEVIPLVGGAKPTAPADHGG
jgi:hypothetical protein